MEIATYLLFALGCLGALDILLFHSVAHGIRSHADSRTELITHSLRGPTYAALFVLIPNVQMHGLYFWALMGLFAGDVAISVWDFSVEGDSRRYLGGLPAGEYVLHMVMAMLFGALVTSTLFATVIWTSLSTRLVYHPAAVPDVLRLVMAIMAVGVFVSGVLDAVAAVRLGQLARPSERSPLARG